MTTPLFRWLLRVAALFNVFGAGLLGFPGSVLGQWAGLPAAVPLIYRSIVGIFVLLFGGCYAWLGSQPVPDRSMVALGAIGKSSVVVALIALWLAGEASFSTLAVVSGDLVFAALFVWWLSASKRTA